jgi:channel protein (hemolysin III family)
MSTSLFHLAQIIPIPGFGEPVSSWSHFLAAGVYAWMGIQLLRRTARVKRDPVIRSICVGVFAITAVTCLAISGTFHGLHQASSAREALNRIDHAAIFFLIAGTFTGVHGMAFRGLWRWLPIAVLWSLAATSVTFKTIFFHSFPTWLGMSLYLVLGWLGMVSGFMILRKRGFRAMSAILWGGIAYTIGAILFTFNEHIPQIIPGVVGGHEIFHVAVIVGLGFHWGFISRNVNCPTPIETKRSARRFDQEEIIPHPPSRVRPSA